MKELEITDELLYPEENGDSGELMRISALIEADRKRYSSKADIEEEIDEY